MDDNELFEKMEAIHQVINRIEQKEQLAIQETVESFFVEENFRQ